MADIDKSSPADDDIVSQFPANERSSRGAIEEIIDIEHYAQQSAGANQGFHRLLTLVEQASDPTALADKAIVYSKEVSGIAEVFIRFENGTVLQLTAGQGINVVPSGTKMLFAQASPPAGWTQDTSQNDRVLRVVSGAGGGTGGSWTISGVTVDGHALTIDEMPSHNHSISNVVRGGGSGTSGGGNINNTASSFNSGSRGGGQAHDHGLTADGTWRPAYQDVIVATKD